MPKNTVEPKKSGSKDLSLDRTDMRVLYQLDLDSRQPFSSIARKLATSKEVVNYRVKRLLSQGLIKQFTTVIDSGRMGYLNFRLFLRLQNVTPHKEEEMIGFLARRPEITTLVRWEGHWTLDAVVCVKEPSGMDKVWKEFSKRYRRYVQEHLISIYMSSRYHKRAHLLGMNKDEAGFEEFISSSKSVKTDDKDARILKMLANDARTPLLAIANELSLTSKAISYRIGQLRKKGVIQGFRSRFQLEMLGYSYYKIFIYLHSLDNEKIGRLRSFLRQHPNVLIVSEILGGGDLEVEVQVRRRDEFREFLLDIRERFSDIIRTTESMTAIEEHKFNYLPSNHQ